MKPFLIIQLRPETEAADEEYASFLKRGQLRPEQTLRIRLDRQEIAPDLALDSFSGVIVGGGPGCVSDDPKKKDPVEARMEAALLRLMPEITRHDFPFLGCCAGIGILGHHLGAPVSKERFGEPVGEIECLKTDAGQLDPLLAGLPDRFAALVGHKEALDALPAGTTHLVHSDACPFQMIRYGNHVYATQFHPESNGESFALRIRLYQGKGYFREGEAEELTRKCLLANTEVSGRIIGNFTRIYGQ
jgi:GMP synthase (glutamine-hydrolysing)